MGSHALATHPPTLNPPRAPRPQVTLDLKMALPQVAVVGSQSSGKSSVLEALVGGWAPNGVGGDDGTSLRSSPPARGGGGYRWCPSTSNAPNSPCPKLTCASQVGRDFLPRGPDICTRRPLVLQLVKTPAAGQPGKTLPLAGPSRLVPSCASCCCDHRGPWTPGCACLAAAHARCCSQAAPRRAALKSGASSCTPPARSLPTLTASARRSRLVRAWGCRTRRGCGPVGQRLPPRGCAMAPIVRARACWQPAVPRRNITHGPAAAPGVLGGLALCGARAQGETERVSGANKGISDKPIRLKICSPNVL